MIKISDVIEYDQKKLQDSYNEALKNKDFKEFISKLKIDDDILMKYTSTLEECSLEYNK